MAWGQDYKKLNFKALLNNQIKVLSVCLRRIWFCGNSFQESAGFFGSIILSLIVPGSNVEAIVN